MATRQYIGARYTPKFSGTYDATQAYEALEVVDNGSGTTYIARKPVPPNTALTNTEYWLVYGSSSGAILDLQDRVSDIENDDLPAINNNITHINGSIATMGGQISTNATAISGINTKLQNVDKALNYDKWLIITDSYGMEPAPEQSLSKYLPEYLHIPEANCQVKYRSGAGFGNGLFKDDCLLPSTFDSSDPVHIIVIGGFNDGSYLLTHTASELDAKFTEFYTAAKTKYPNSDIRVAFVAGETQAVLTERNNGDALRLAEAEYKTLPFYGMFYLEGCDTVMKDIRLIDATGFHPTSSGGMMLAATIANAIMTGFGTTYRKRALVPLSSNISGSVDNTTKLYQVIDEKIANIELELSMSNVSFGLTTNWQTIATASNPLFSGSSKMTFPARFTYRNASGIAITWVTVRFVNNAIQIRGTENISGITIVAIENFFATVPIDWIW